MFVNGLFFMILLGCLTTSVHAQMSCEKLLDISAVYELSDKGSPFITEDGQAVVVGVTEAHMIETLFRAYSDVKNYYGSDQKAIEDGSSLVFANIKPKYRLNTFLNSFYWFRLQDVNASLLASHVYRGYFEYVQNTSIPQEFSFTQSDSSLENPLIVDISGVVLGFSENDEPILDPKSIVITYKMRVKGSVLSLIMKKLEEDHLSRYELPLRNRLKTKLNNVTYANQFNTLEDFNLENGDVETQYKSRALNINITSDDNELFVTTRNRLPVGFVEKQNLGNTKFLEFSPKSNEFYDIEIFNRSDNVLTSTGYEEFNHLSNQNRMVSFLITNLLPLFEEN